MRLSTLVVRRFKSIDEVRLVIPRTDTSRPGSADFVTILGPNNAGKSSILEALRLALPGTDIARAEVDHFPHRNPDNGPIEVELEFDDISPAEAERHGVRTHVYDGRYRIKKVWHSPGAKPEIFAYHPKRIIRGWDDNATLDELRSRSPEWKAAVESWEQSVDEPVKKFTKARREQLRQYILETGGPLVEEGPPEWQPNPGGLSSNPDSVLPQVIFVPAIRETKDEASVTERKSAARQIAERLFQGRLRQHEAIQAFERAGEDVKKLFQEGHEVIRELESRITKKFERLIPIAARLGFEPPDVTADLASKVQFQVEHENVVTWPEHQGHGAQRAMVLSLLEILAEEMLVEEGESGLQRNLLLLIEEPEIYLHAQMQRKIRDVLLQIARSGTAQVICTSHSPVFIDLADRHDGIVLVDRQAGRVRVRQRADDLFKGETAEDERNRLRMLLNFDPSVNEVLKGTPSEQPSTLWQSAWWNLATSIKIIIVSDDEMSQS